jgi:hypothetical protein
LFPLLVEFPSYSIICCGIQCLNESQHYK